MFGRVGLFSSHLVLSTQMTRYAACAVLSIAGVPCVFPYSPSIADWATAGVEAAPQYYPILVYPIPVPCPGSVPGSTPILEYDSKSD